MSIRRRSGTRGLHFGSCNQGLPISISPTVLCTDMGITYNLYNRIELWEQIATQLTDYDKFLDINVKTLDSLVKIKESEITVVYWCLFNCGEEFN